MNASDRLTGCLPRARLRRIHAADAGMTVFVSIHDEKPLLVVVKVEPVENRGVVGGENDLLVVLLRKRDELLQQRDAQLGVERTVDVVDREEGGRVRADEKRDVEEEEKESFIRAPLVEQGTVRKEAIANPDAPFARTEIVGNIEALKPIDQRQPLLDLHQALLCVFG